MQPIRKTTVLVLNRCWQAIHVKTPAEAFTMLSSGAATGLDIGDDGQLRPVTWAVWLSLPVRPSDASIGTVRGPVRGPVRVPTVIVLARYDKVPRRKPGFSPRAIWQRDGGVCQYTGRRLQPHEGNIDHIVPRSRGGPNTWQNCVLADRRINARKGSRLIRNAHQIRDWNLFLETE